MKRSTFWDNFMARYGGPRDDSPTEKGRLRQAVSDLTLVKLMRPGTGSLNTRVSLDHYPL